MMFISSRTNAEASPKGIVLMEEKENPKQLLIQSVILIWSYAIELVAAIREEKYHYQYKYCILTNKIDYVFLYKNEVTMDCVFVSTHPDFFRKVVHLHFFSQLSIIFPKKLKHLVSQITRRNIRTRS